MESKRNQPMPPAIVWVFSDLSRLAPPSVRHQSHISLTGAVSLTKLLPAGVGQWPKSAYRDGCRRTAEIVAKAREIIWFTGEARLGSASQPALGGSRRASSGICWAPFAARPPPRRLC